MLGQNEGKFGESTEVEGAATAAVLSASAQQHHNAQKDHTPENSEDDMSASIVSKRQKARSMATKPSGTNPLQRRNSGSATATAGIFGDAELTPAATESDFDKYAAQQITSLHRTNSVLEFRVGQLESSVASFANIGSELESTNQSVQRVAQYSEARFEDMDSRLSETNTRIQHLAQEIGLANFDVPGRIAHLEAGLVEAYYRHIDATAALASANGDAAAASAQQDIDLQQEAMDDAAKGILVLRAQENLGQSTFPLVENAIDNLQKQLRQVIRKKQTDMSATATNSWSRRNLWATDKDAQALRSVQKLAKNPAFSGLEKRNDNELAMNQRLLELMTHATFALSHFYKIVTPTPVQSTSTSGASAAQRLPVDVVSTPLRGGLSSTTTMKSPAAQQPQLLDADIVNHAVMEVMRAELAQIQTEAGGLIGSPNKNLQYWGKVLMIIALSILAIVSAVALMSMLGFATPAFLVPYLAAVQSMSMITTVLNFVAAKLTLDLNTAAAVTAVAVAGTFGMFGKVTHYAGAPTSLKSDLDRAAQDLEAALADTPAATMSR